MQNTPQFSTLALTPVVSPIPFAMCGIDLVGKLPNAKGEPIRYCGVYYPKSNGKVEVMNHIILKGIKKNILQSGKSGGSWIEELPTVLWSLHSMPNQATGEAPFSLEEMLPPQLLLPQEREGHKQKGKSWQNRTSNKPHPFQLPVDRQRIFDRPLLPLEFTEKELRLRFPKLPWPFSRLH
ncbi:hypothetical protein LIER_29504 [Lithospermum erythrorhizon]|uniref:Uncharacterized protein n=1 Tax=Lithospermum erythrorhizon TaxID=34254 RepID=A0AAV3RJU5_LITER